LINQTTAIGADQMKAGALELPISLTGQIALISLKLPEAGKAATVANRLDPDNSPA
jgi:hypothetical protein